MRREVLMWKLETELRSKHFNCLDEWNTWLFKLHRSIWVFHVCTLAAYKPCKNSVLLQKN